MKEKRKKELYSVLLVLLIIGISLGYAALSATLNINGFSKVKDNTWDIHFKNLQVNSNSVTLSAGDSAAVINPSDNKEVTYNVTLKKPGDFYEFMVDAKNFGTIDGMIESVTSKLNGTVIDNEHPLPVYLDYSVTYSDDIPIDSYHLLTAGSEVTYKVHLEFKKDIDESDLPENDITPSFSFGITSIQADNTAIIKPEWPVIGNPTMTSNTYRSNAYRNRIKTINLDDEINPPANPVVSWDIGVAQNGNVMAYITENAADNTMYNLYIQGDGALYANPDSSDLFYMLHYVDSINNMDVLDTSNVTNMNKMFYRTGYNSTSFTLDLGNKFDTSQVTDMAYMFWGTGHDSTVFTLDLGNKFDTSNVTNMEAMFLDTGHNSTVFTLDLGNKFDTSKVTNMYSMFNSTGHTSTVFTLDLGDKFDTSSVTNMNQMFYGTGYNSAVFTLNLGNKFDTSNVINMQGMFRLTGCNSTIFTLNLGNKFDISNVTNISYMFSHTGYNNNNFELDISTFDFSSVTDFGGIFYEFKATQKIYVKDAATRDWILNNIGNTNLTTANVLIKS